MHGHGLWPTYDDSQLTDKEKLLLSTPLPHDLSPKVTEGLWHGYQAVLEGMLMNMGRMNEGWMLDAIKRTAPEVFAMVSSINKQIALALQVADSALRELTIANPRRLFRMLAAEFRLMEWSAAAGYRTFCFLLLVMGLAKTGKMQYRPVQRMIDTFEFEKVMLRYPMNHPRALLEWEKTNNKHKELRVAGGRSQEERDLFKYIAFNMFVIGPYIGMKLTPQERHALFGLTVLIAERMGQVIEGSVRDHEQFIERFEAEQMFDLSDPEQSEPRATAIAIAHASRDGLKQIRFISEERVHQLVPPKVKKILEL